MSRSDRYERLLGRAALLRVRFRAVPGCPYSTWSLINRAVVRFGEAGPPDAQSSRFEAAMLLAMRCVLIDLYRENAAERRGGGRPTVDLHSGIAARAERRLDDRMSALLAALEVLRQRDPQKHAMIEDRYVNCLSAAEIAKRQERSADAVQRDFDFLRSWLRYEIRRQGAD